MRGETVGWPNRRWAQTAARGGASFSPRTLGTTEGLEEGKRGHFELSGRGSEKEEEEWGRLGQWVRKETSYRAGTESSTKCQGLGSGLLCSWVA